jgi:hypothetical protein
MSSASQLFHFAFRWSTPHTAEAQAQLYSKLKGVISDKFIFQAENTISPEGKENPHYQGYFHTKEKRRAKEMAVKLNTEFRGIEVQASSTEGKIALQGYCMKQDTRVGGPWTDKYMGTDLWSEEKMPQWQQDMIANFEEHPGDRLMYWIYDEHGNNGKTKFIKYLAFKQDALPLGYGHSTDILNLVSKFPGKSLYAFNLTRPKPANLSELDLYSAMESIKDGIFINTKYETAVVMMDPPHIMVCANYLPKYNQISADRWCVLSIQNSQLIKVTL